MNDRKLTKEEKLELIQKIANDGGLYELNKFLNEITFKITEEPPIKEETTDTNVEVNTTVFKAKNANTETQPEESANQNIQKEEIIESPATIEQTPIVEEPEIKIEEDNDPNTASIYRQDALSAVRKDLEDLKARSSSERTTEIISEPIEEVTKEKVEMENKPKTLTLEKNDPWGSADGIKHATPGQNI